MEKILSGKPIAAAIKTTIKSIIEAHDLRPSMSLVQIGSDPSSGYYVQNIISNGEKLGCTVQLCSLPENASQDEIISVIRSANADPSVHGIMIQKPLQQGISEAAIIAELDPMKDIDCLHPLNLGKIILDQDGVLPCTPLAVLFTLIYYDIKVSGLNVVIIGRSSIVGKPLANMLLWKKPYADATVTVCHSRTRQIQRYLQEADVIVAAIGQAEYLKSNAIKENCILIDVGINEKVTAEGKSTFVGDIDYNSCYDKALAITPVPGGIGTVTSALLFLNLIKACLASQGTNKTVDDFIALIFYDK